MLINVMLIKKHNEESYPILTVPMTPTVGEAINMHNADEYLFGKKHLNIRPPKSAYEPL